LDVTLEEDWKKAIEKTLQAFGKLDILVNNSGKNTQADHVTSFAVIGFNI
jgi:NAD(P)-dependent dehydrogenase (short-subunit alcohol dehydrogenase family)